MVERQLSGSDKWPGSAGFVDRVNAIVRAIAPPSLTQLALRLALAVPFWRSAVNKWDGIVTGMMARGPPSGVGEGMAALRECPEVC